MGHAYLVGDANLDGQVDGLDFIEWNRNKFTPVAAWSAGDFTANGFVDGDEFIEWNRNKFLNSDSVAAVPEPSGLLPTVLVLAGGLCGWAFRRRTCFA